MNSIDKIAAFSMDYFSLKGKVAIVTGANQGLGMGYAVAFAKAGADLYIPHYTEDVADVKRLIEAEGRRVAFIRGDLTDRNYLKSVVEGCMKEYGRIDILVNNAGTNHFAPFLEFPDEAFDRVLELQLKTVYFLGHEVAKIMVKQGGGKIINIGSALSYTADRKCPAYVTAKHGVMGITRDFANELGQYNIQCNAICPGFIQTDMNIAVSADKAFYDHITGRIAAGYWGDLSDLMGTAVFLASKASDYVNGAEIKVDGGFSCVL
ncbi:MAG: SDR family oxidoreductase [Clostridiales bacterium]|jgi:2-deoxy-D-gluconate 3-dehydrogenase|nr:SDR family oxidoreductase [Clostridiales bacterium]